MPGKKIGLYLGAKSVGVVVAEKKNIASLATLELSSLEEEAKVESLSEDVRWEALINRTLREAGAEGKSIYVSLADKDFIYRSIEMPLMKKKDIESSLAYEVEKYIPFKVDELIWDYDYTSFSKEKKINLSFVGIREADYQRTQSIFSRLGLNSVVVEPSSLSLVKVLKSYKGFSNLKDFAFLDFTEQESYLTFFYQDLPVFNRYLTINKKEGVLELDKFMETVRLSFQYFRREFSFYQLEKCIIVGNSRDDSLVSSLKEELQTDVEMVTPYDLTGTANSTVESIKALGVVAAEQYPYKFKPTLKKIEKPQEYAEGEGEVAAAAAGTEAVPLNTGLLGILAGIGLIITLGLATYMGYEISTKRYELKIERDNLFLPSALTGITTKEIEDLLKNKQSEVENLKNIIPSFKGISAFLEKMPSLLPAGMWLDSLDLTKSGNNYTVTLRGNIYLGDNYQERTQVYNFVSSLGKDEATLKVFSNVKLVSIDRGDSRGFAVTVFSIKLE
jgi:hypothetical protein